MLVAIKRERKGKSVAIKREKKKEKDVAAKKKERKGILVAWGA